MDFVEDLSSIRNQLRKERMEMMSLATYIQVSSRLGIERREKVYGVAVKAKQERLLHAQKKSTNLLIGLMKKPRNISMIDLSSIQVR
jgi:hypothetical protein